MTKTAKRKSSSKKATHKEPSLKEKVEILRVKYLALLESHNHNAVVINTIKDILVKKGYIDPDKDLPESTKSSIKNLLISSPLP